MRPADLEPRRHAPPPDWPAEVFEAVTTAFAAALVAGYRRAAAEPDAAVETVERESIVATVSACRELAAPGTDA